MTDQQLLDRLNSEHDVLRVFLLALLSTHPNPRQVMRRYRAMKELMLDLYRRDSAVDETRVSQFLKTAASLDQIVQILMPELDPQHYDDDPATDETGSKGS